MQVRLFKSRIDQLLKQTQEPDDVKGADSPGDSPSVAKLFEEIKVMFQDMPSRVEARLFEGGAPISRRRRRRLHPMMFDELVHMLPHDPGDPLGLLLIAGAVRDDIPWLYELIIDSYREAKAGNFAAAKRTMRSLRQASKAMMSGPWIEEMGLHPGEMEMVVMELPRMLDRYMSRFEDMTTAKRPAKGKLAASAPETPE